MKKLFLTVMLASLTTFSVFAAPSTTGNINKDFNAVPKSQFKTYADVKTWTETWYKENKDTMPRPSRISFAAVQLAYNNLAGNSDMYDDCMTEITNVYNTTNKTQYATVSYLNKQASVIIRLSGTKLTNEQKFTKLVEIENELYKLTAGNRKSKE
jgi:predicted DNA binding CopG/RHH family protein